MTARSLLAAWTLVAALLPRGSARAEEWDWYHQREGSKGARESADDDGYVPPYGGGSGPRASSEGFSPGLRLAYGQPLGEVANGGDLEDFIKGALKAQLDLDYGLNPHFMLGVYLAMGGGFLPKATKRPCDTFGGDCGLMVIESGLQAAFRFLPDRLVDPWLGANLGLEWVRFKAEAMGAKSSIAYLGLVFGPTLGVDVQLNGFAFGPYFSPQFGEYMRGKVKVSSTLFGTSNDGKIENRAFHYWLNFGLRARYQF
jgi:hypothetical protein